MALDLLRCPQCFDLYCDPYCIKECGHTLCKGCALKKPLAQRVQSGKRTCPICYAQFEADCTFPNHALQLLLWQVDAASKCKGEDEENCLTVQSSCSTLDSLDKLGSGLNPRESFSESFIDDDDSSFTSEQRSGAYYRLVGDTSATETLCEIGVPIQLANVVLNESNSIARRIFLLDNSLSTKQFDGRVLQEDEDGCWWRRCSWWEEIVDVASRQASWNAKLGVPTEFILTNNCSSGHEFQEPSKHFEVNVKHGDTDAQLVALGKDLAEVDLTGDIDMVQRLKEIHEDLKLEAGKFAQRSQQIVLVIVTHSLPSDKDELVRILNKLSTDLPLRIIFRLCTDKPQVASFYDNICAESSADIQAIDDLESSAIQSSKVGNGFVTYSKVLHVIREAGTSVKAVELLTERQLDPAEVVLLSQLLVRRPGDDPLPSNPRLFCAALESVLKQTPCVLDVLSLENELPLRWKDVQGSLTKELAARRECSLPFEWMWQWWF